MYKAQIISNKLVEQRKKQMDDEVHTKTLQTMKHRVDAEQPQSTQLSFLNTRIRDKIYINKYQTIDKENKLLLDKITNIMQNPQNSYNQFGKISNTTMNPMTHAQRQLGFHQARRKKELIRIALDNQKLLQRIQQKKPTYDVDKWEDDMEKNQKYLKNICHHDPTRIVQKNSTIYNNHVNTKSLNQISNHKSHSTNKDDHQNSQNGKAAFITNNQNEKKKVVICKKSKKIGDQNYIVQIFIENRQLIVFMNNAKLPDKYLFQIDEKMGLQFIKENYRNNVEQLVDDLVYKDNNFSIKNTQYHFDKLDNKVINVLGSLSIRTKYNSKKTTKKNTQVTEESEDDIEPFISKTTNKKNKKQIQNNRKHQTEDNINELQDRMTLKQEDDNQDKQEYKVID